MSFRRRVSRGSVVPGITCRERIGRMPRASYATGLKLDHPAPLSRVLGKNWKAEMKAHEDRLAAERTREATDRINFAMEAHRGA